MGLCVLVTHKWVKMRIAMSECSIIIEESNVVLHPPFNILLNVLRREMEDGSFGLSCLYGQPQRSGVKYPSVTREAIW